MLRYYEPSFPTPPPQKNSFGNSFMSLLEN